VVRKTITRAASLLDALAALFPDSSRTTLRQMLQRGRVRVNAETEKDAKRRLEAGDFIDVGSKAMEVRLPPGLGLLHEDADVLVVVKACGLLTVPTERDPEETAQAYLNEYLRAKRHGRVHVVHRLDRETSGVLVFAKNFHARESLKEQFAEHSVERLYVAIVEGKLDPPSGTIRSFLREEKSLRMKSVKGDPEARLAVTHYRTVHSGNSYSMLEVRLETGRKNQIRAHLSEAGHPVIGDQFYGSRSNPISRLGLHAQLLGFRHPTTGQRMTFSVPIPREFRELQL
jgi:23S rRNA pseudouridine1911/1915/1917 synthase